MARLIFGLLFLGCIILTLIAWCLNAKNIFEIFLAYIDCLGLSCFAGLIIRDGIIDYVKGGKNNVTR